MKIMCVLLLFIAGVMLVACQNQQTPPIVGGDKDSHGCIGSAGYSWCDSKQKCIRPWEENCTATDNTSLNPNCNYDDPNKSYIKKESNCVINFACTKDKQAFRDECGCGCKTVHTCTDAEKKNQICTMEYIGVCGNDGVTYATGCTACAAGIDSYVMGECPVLEHVCTQEEKQNNACTMDYNPVCAKVDNGIRCIRAPCPSVDLKTYPNGCTACSDEKVYSYTPGECPSNTTNKNTGKEVSCSDSAGTYSLTLNQAIDIAKKSECGDNLIVDCSCPQNYDYQDGICNPKCLSQGCKMASIQCEKTYVCNENTATFWINLNTTKQGCNPACVVDLKTQTAQINWRCTGLISPNN